MMPESAPLTAPRFSIAERDRRHAATRARMAERGLACLIVPHHTGDWDNYQADTRYLTCVGGGGTATALVFPLEGEPMVAVREARRIEWWRASQDWVSDIRSPPQFRWAPFFEKALKELGLQDSAIGVVGLTEVLRDPEGIVSHGELTALRAALPGARFQPATDLMDAVRKRKSAEEIAMMERAQECADAISDALRSTARPGASEHEVYAAMTAAHIRQGGELPTMMLFGAGPRMWQTQLLPSFRRLEPGDILLIEAEAKYAGYMAQAVDTVSLRPLSRLEARLLDVSAECFEALLSACRPGTSYAALIRLWEDFARKAGCVAGRTMGHGLGLGQDGPLTTPAGDAGGLLVEEGDCLVIKPWIADAEDTASGRVGGTVVVDHRGARRLGRSALRPLVVG
jgi:Xaa-Pro dipeptidase